MRTGRAYRDGGYSHKDGQISVAGRLVPAAITDAIYAWMHTGEFRQREVREYCLVTLRAAKFDPTVCDALAERMIEIAATSGWITVARREGRIKFWTWVHPDGLVCSKRSTLPELPGTDLRV